MLSLSLHNALDIPNEAVEVFKRVTKWRGLGVDTIPVRKAGPPRTVSPTGKRAIGRGVEKAIFFFKCRLLAQNSLLYGFSFLKP